MKDSFTVTTDIITLFDNDTFKANITGAIYSNDRPAGSKLIDIVVNCFGITNRQIQIASPNINIYTPSLPSGRSDSVTLRKVVRALLPYLDTQYRSDFSINIEDAGTLMKDTDGSWFYNIPLNYSSVQTNFKNI